VTVDNKRLHAYQDSKVDAVALLSGGLDSSLAILVLLRQNIPVTALTFLNHFGCDITDSSSCSRDPLPVAEKFGFTVKLSHLADKFLHIVRNPKYGHGKNMNPCIDCRILMLREAKTFMDMIGARFLVTGEVLGQRPMSQRRDSFPLIDREAGVEGIVLRPLSAKLLTPTIPEIQGLVDREKLYDFKGRSRKPQMSLAKELGLNDYPSPAGGCLLTEPTYAMRLRDLLRYNPEPSSTDIHLLRIGRHFRISSHCKIAVGRNMDENEKILIFMDSEDTIMKVEGVGSPVTLIIGTPSTHDLMIAASITARYSDSKHLPIVGVTLIGVNGKCSMMSVSPAPDSLLDTYRIASKNQRKKKFRKLSAVH
jgi:tRNA U34 2-thiouridine synthase MnmA/TrmU